MVHLTNDFFALNLYLFKFYSSLVPVPLCPAYCTIIAEGKNNGKGTHGQGGGKHPPKGQKQLPPSPAPRKWVPITKI